MSQNGSGKKRRLFIALPINIKDATPIKPVLDILNNNSQILKNVNTELYHITMKFLGDIGKEKCDKIINSFEQIGIKHGPIPFTIQGIGAFPNVKRASILWFGIETSIEKLISIQNRIEEFAKKFGFEEEKRPFKPHITIARLRKGNIITRDLAVFIEENKSKEFLELTFNRIVLYESILSSSGPTYRPLKTIEL